MEIGFVGIGVMGRSMARHLMKAGHRLTVYTRTRAKAEALLAEGALWAEDAGACARAAEVVITIVGFPADVEEVYFGPRGILKNARPGTVAIDMTTTSPDLSARIAREATALGIEALDAPVSGGDVGAQNASLSIMVGGARPAFERCLPILQAMGTNIRYMGEAGSGQHAKMANQIAIAGTLAGVCEAMAYAQSAGLDQRAVLDAIAAGAAGSWQMSNQAPKMIEGDDAPGFYIKHFIKDMAIAQAEAQARGLELPVLDAVLEAFRGLAERGLGEAGTQALIRAYLPAAREG